MTNYGKAPTWDIRTSLAATSPTIAIIYIGTNNYAEDYYLSQGGSIADVSCGLNLDSLQRLWDAVVYYPGITGVVITTIEDAQIPDGTENVNGIVRKYVADRRAQGKNVCLGELPANFAGLTEDRFHPNALGREAIATALVGPTLLAIGGSCAAGSSLPVVTIANASHAAEPSTNGSFTVTRTGSNANSLTVNFAVGGSAAPGSDYQGLGTSVTINSGSNTATLPVLVNDDNEYEGTETVVVTLANGASYTVGASPTAVVTITDNDPQPAGPTVTSLSPVSRGTWDTVSWTGVINATPRDWLGLYPVGGSAGQFYAWIYTSTCTQGVGVAKAAGACGLYFPGGLPTGTYQIRLLANDGFNIIATSNPITVP